MFFAGIALGLTTSIRILGPAAGALVLLVWDTKEKPQKIVLPALAYYAIALLTSLFFWPYLWKETFTRLINTFHFMSLPWKGAVLISGRYFPSSELPWYYLPKLIPLQITLPALFLFIFGTGIAFFQISKTRKIVADTILPLTWFFLPLFAWMIIRPTTFDNFRHFLFIMPPVFLLAGQGFSHLFKYIKKQGVLVLLSILLLPPGFIAGFILHPYQYVYYKGLVGWTPNIYNRYESDYWGTSMCEAGKFLDSKINEKTRIFFTDHNLGRIFNHCTQQSPQLVYQQGNAPHENPDYAVILARWGHEHTIFPI